MEPGARPANPNSPILAMHARYERLWHDHHVADVAGLATAETQEGHHRKIDFEQAMAALEAESDALRVAILYQVPGTHAEAAVLQFYIAQAVDDTDERETAAVRVAVDALLDFMACDQSNRGESLSRMMTQVAGYASKRRRARTGGEA